jgi:formate dehydrogenase subunit delta
MAEDRIAYMANQIATAFRSRPEAEAAEAVADHVNKFWEPRMRAQLLARVEAGDPELSATVVAAAPLVRRPAHA